MASCFCRFAFSILRHHLLKAPLNRRQFLGHTLAVGSAVALPWFVPARARGRDGAVAPSEKIVLGGISLGPRGQYDLSMMLPEKDVQVVAI